MKNLNRTRNAQIILAMLVAAGTKSGDVVLIGSDGLRGLAHTDRVTAEALAPGSIITPPPGLAAGEASVELIGVHVSVNLPVAVGGNAGDALYKINDGTYSPVDSGDDTFIGYALKNFAAGETVPVGLT